MKNNGNVQVPAMDEEASGLFHFPNLTGTAERNLLMAVLERAIRDFVGNSTEEAEAARAWLFEIPEGEGAPFSFGWVCHQLDLQPVRVLAKVASMPKRGAHRTAPWYFMKEASA